MLTFKTFEFVRVYCEFIMVNLISEKLVVFIIKYNIKRILFIHDVYEQLVNICRTIYLPSIRLCLPYTLYSL
jgi:hypothetical protein